MKYYMNLRTTNLKYFSFPIENIEKEQVYKIINQEKELKFKLMK